MTLSSAGALQFSAASTIQTTGGTALAGTVGRTGGAGKSLRYDDHDDRCHHHFRQRGEWREPKLVATRAT